MWYDRFERSQPREAKGGIKARSRRGAFGESWWAQRWIEVLERLDEGGRLSRGRGYARSGQVLSIDIEKGLVTARVQGSRSRPYDVRIELAPFPASEWKGMIERLSARAVFAAKLAAGEMPKEIEGVFRKAGLSLFPRQRNDLTTECSCPDWSNPCKHVAAVYYLLAEEFDRDPFLLFKLRGMTRERLIAGLSGKRAGASRRTKPASVVEPLPSDPMTFWGTKEGIEEITGSIDLPPVQGALLHQLDGFPFWRGRHPIAEELMPMYGTASDRTLELLTSESLRRASTSDEYGR
jgi:uncharacterized Zn finger protein